MKLGRVLADSPLPAGPLSQQGSNSREVHIIRLVLRMAAILTNKVQAKRSGSYGHTQVPSSIQSLSASVLQQLEQSGLLRWLAELAQATAQQLHKHADSRGGAVLSGGGSASGGSSRGRSSGSSGSIPGSTTGTSSSSSSADARDTDLTEHTLAVLKVLEEVQTLGLCSECDANVADALAAVSLAGMQLIPAVGGYVSVSLPGKGPSGQQLDPDISLAELVGSTASLLTMMCGICIAKLHPDVAGSLVYLRWSSISAVILSYASLFQDEECLPSLSSNISSNDASGSKTAAACSIPDGSSGSSSNRSTASTRQAASQTSSIQRALLVPGATQTWIGAACAAWGRASQQPHAIPPSHLELLALLGFSREAALWVAACWAIRACGSLLRLQDLMAVNPCVKAAAGLRAGWQVQAFPVPLSSTKAGSARVGWDPAACRHMLHMCNLCSSSAALLQSCCTSWQEVCLRLPAVLMYWAAHQQDGSFLEASLQAGKHSAPLATVVAQQFELLVEHCDGGWPEGTAPITSEAAISDTLQCSVLVLNRLQQLRLKPASSSSSSKSMVAPSQSTVGEALVMVLLSLVARLP